MSRIGSGARNRRVSKLAGIALVVAGIFGEGCSKTEERTQIIPPGILLTRDLSRENQSFEVLKVDLPSGSYGLINNHLHWYAGNTIWKDVEYDLTSDPWKRALKEELQHKVESREIFGEGVIYKSDGNVQD
jgi:hypothetical protein